MKIKFVINERRKGVKSNFNPKLSKYWQKLFNDLFREW